MKPNFTQMNSRSEQNRSFLGLSAFQLKVLACIFMVSDHIGAELYPDCAVLRIIGRLTFPIFAFFIAEGCRYTRNRLRRFGLIFLLGVLCETVYVWYGGVYYGNILLTFSLSILLIYAWQEVRKHLAQKETGMSILTGLMFAGALGGVYVLCRRLGVDYGFAGVVTPLLVSVLDGKSGAVPAGFYRWQHLYGRLLLLSVGLSLIILQGNVNQHQAWSFLALPLLALYNGQVGRSRFKYGFYLFYPLHLAVIGLISQYIR